MPAAPAQKLLFRRRQRLSHDREFQAVFAARCSSNRGPLRIHARFSGLPHTRLGLSIGRRFGNAVARNHLKRLLREAFRLEQRRLPTGIDLVISVNPHDPLPLADYRALLVEAATLLARQLETRRAKESGA
ncbi:MAG: ribonuclease P protein component [Phycisphaerales bacterium]